MLNSIIFRLNCNIRIVVASLMLITTRRETLSLTFAYLAMFCKIYTYPKQINYFNFKLTDIDNTKPSPKSGAV